MNIRCPPDLESVDSFAGEFAMLNGQRVDASDVEFYPDTYRFFYKNDDVTNQIRQADKIANWPNFNQAKDNERAYAEAYAAKHGGASPTPTGSTSTVATFIKQIFTEPLKAPSESLQRQVQGSPAVQAGIVVVTLGLVYLIVAKLTNLGK